MNDQQTRRDFLKAATLLPLCAGALGGEVPVTAKGPIKRLGGSALKVSLNAYSFSKLLNDQNKGRAQGISLFDLLDFCAKHNFDGVDPTGYFFPTYPAVPPDEYVNNLKRRAFELGVGISGTGVRNNFTLPDKQKRAADVQHIKEWVEVAARLGAPVLRVFADTQMRGQSWQTVAPDHTREQVEEWIAENLKECAEQGRKCGVIIGVQNHGDFLKTGDNLISLISRVNSDWCGAIVDTGYFRSDDPYKDMAKVAPFAVNWQIKQSPLGVEAEGSSPTDLKRLLRLVRDSGYRGYLPIETLSSKNKPEAYDPFTVVPKFLKELREAIAQTA
jgi:sugar phosphate isomerase/epimerase